MTWVKLDDRFPDDPKVEQLSAVAFRLYVSALCYCGRHETDGCIPRIRVQRLLPTGNHRKAAAELVTAGLWAEGDDCYVIHMYLKYNLAHAVLEQKRVDDRLRKGLDSARIPDGIPDGIQTESDAESAVDSERNSRGGPRGRHPVPSRPIPVAKTSRPIPVTPRAGSEAAKAAVDRERVKEWLVLHGYEADHANAEKLIVGKLWAADTVIAALEAAQQYSPKRPLTYIQSEYEGKPSLLSRVKVEREIAAHNETRAEENHARSSSVAAL